MRLHLLVSIHSIPGTVQETVKSTDQFCDWAEMQRQALTGHRSGPSLRQQQLLQLPCCFLMPSQWAPPPCCCSYPSRLHTKTPEPAGHTHHHSVSSGEMPWSSGVRMHSRWMDSTQQMKPCSVVTLSLRVSGSGTSTTCLDTRAPVGVVSSIMSPSRCQDCNSKPLVMCERHHACGGPC